jgi:hypothetical protein
MHRGRCNHSGDFDYLATKLGWQALIKSCLVDDQAETQAKKKCRHASQSAISDKQKNG